MDLPAGLDLKGFDPRTATDGDFEPLVPFSNALQAELRPDSPPSTREELQRTMQSLPQLVASYGWHVWRGLTVVAGAYFSAWKSGQNQHLAEFWIGVMPGERRRRIGAALLQQVVQAAEHEDRALLGSTSNSNVDAGGRFLARMGCTIAVTWQMAELAVQAANLQAVESWLRRGEELTRDFELGLWAGSYPEEDLEAVVRMVEVMNTAPRGGLQVEDQHLTVEEQRELDRSLIARGIERWTLYARDRETGEIAGFTEVHWNASRPGELTQADTGVFLAYRGRGLGRWLKASMLAKVMQERPEVKVIRTGMAMENAPMRAINDELGYKPRVTSYTWQAPVSVLKERLAGLSR